MIILTHLLTAHLSSHHTHCSNVLVTHSLNLVDVVFIAETIKSEEQGIQVLHHSWGVHLGRECDKVIQLCKHDAHAKVAVGQRSELLPGLNDKVVHLQLIDNSVWKHALQQLLLQICVLRLLSDDDLLLFSHNHALQKHLDIGSLLEERASE